MSGAAELLGERTKIGSGFLVKIGSGSGARKLEIGTSLTQTSQVN